MTLEREPAWHRYRRCPICGAVTGEPCVRVRGGGSSQPKGEPRVRPHDGRHVYGTECLETTSSRGVSVFCVKPGGLHTDRRHVSADGSVSWLQES